MKHVVIVGAGFAGLSCVRKIATRTDVRITLIDKNNYHQFQPLLYQVATAHVGSWQRRFCIAQRAQASLECGLQDG